MSQTYAKIENGTVVNIQIIEIIDILDSNFIWVDITNMFCEDNNAINIGCLYDGMCFHCPPKDPILLLPDSNVIIDNLYNTFCNNVELFPLAPYWGIVETLIIKQNWLGLAQLANGLIQQQLITQTIFDQINSIFIENNLDLNSFT